MEPPRQHLRVETSPSSLEPALQAFVRPALAALAARPEVRAVYFARFQHEALLFVDAGPGWTEGPLRAVIDEHLRPLRDAGTVTGERFAVYPAETERYGGPEGLRLAEQVFQEDSLPCLDLLAADAAGTLPRSRRETSLLLTERLLGLLGFDRAARIAFHRSAYAWALEQGRWDENDLRLLETRYTGMRQGLAELLETSADDDPLPRAWAERLAPALGSLRRAHAAGRIAQDLQTLAWSIAHLQCNRLGIPGEGEAVLRFFMQRLHEDGLGKVA